MGRKKKPEIVQLHLRANRKLIDGLDILVQQEMDRRPGEYVSRANIARSVLTRAVAQATESKEA